MIRRDTEENMEPKTADPCDLSWIDRAFYKSECIYDCFCGGLFCCL